MNSPIPGSDAIPRLATQRAIGWSKVKIKNTKKGQVTVKESVEIQAWELGALAVAAGAFFFLTGVDSTTFFSTIPGFNLPSSTKTKILNWKPSGGL